MTDDIETLRPEVAEAVAAIDGGNGVFVNSDDGIGSAKWQIVRAELLRLANKNRVLELKNRGTLANNLCPDHRDKQVGRPCLACLIEKAEAELAALKARIAGAPVGVPGYDAYPWMTIDDDVMPPEWEGKRVRLVVEE